MIDWILSLIPWWVWLLSFLVAVAIVWALIGWQGALAMAAGLLAVSGYAKGRADASRDERSRRDRDALNHVVIRDRVEDEIDALGAQDVDERLRRWSRAED